MFVDASALVAILTREPGGEALLDALDAAGEATTSALAVFEAATALVRKRQMSVEDAAAEIGTFLRIARITIVSIGEGEMREALLAWSRYGKGRGHPAQLNLGDCFAYACARSHGVPLLFTGEDFSQTDIRSARA